MSIIDDLAGADIVALIATSSLVTAIGTALLSRKRDNFKALSEAYGQLIERVSGLEARLDSVEGKYDDEKNKHENTRSLLSIALLYIRTVMNWGAGDRTGPMPVPPAELQVKPE